MKKTHLEYLVSLETAGIKLGLDRTENLMKACGSPEENLNCIQVVGTNGKGSTSAILANILKECSYKVGLYTSPHLTNINERIRINGQSISDKKIIEFIDLFKNDINKLKVSFFEAMTAMAIWYFKNENVDIAILETGLGGRLDSVSICNPKIIVITRISFDHQHILGNTIEQIALEKAGAIKSNSICVSYPQLGKVKKVLEEKVKKTNSKIKYISKKNNYVNLKGQHQALNATLAIEAIKHLKDFKTTKQNIQLGIKNVIWPGRIQKIFNEPTVYFDVAHNEESFLMLCRFIQNLKIKGSKVLMICLQQNKDLGEAASKIIDLFDDIIITETGVRNFMQVKELHNLLNCEHVHIVKDPNQAAKYIKNLKKNDCGVIAGSHYLGPTITNEFKISFDNI